MKLSHLLISAALAAITPVSAGERRFTFTYEATTAPKGSIELENWVTWKASRGSGGNANQFDFRHELEFGLTDHLQLGLYLSDWSVTRSGGKTETAWSNVGAEFIYNLSNPTTDFLGSALYLETKLGDELFALEGKLLLQKNFGPWVVAYNISLEATWEGAGYGEQVGEFQQTLGVSYQVSPHFTVGAEFLHEVVFENWSAASDHALYVGPNASVRFGRAFATATVLFQASDLEDEPNVQSRLIFGIEF